MGGSTNFLVLSTSVFPLDDKSSVVPVLPGVGGSELVDSRGWSVAGGKVAGAAFLASGKDVTEGSGLSTTILGIVLVAAIPTRITVLRDLVSAEVVIRGSESYTGCTPPRSLQGGAIFRDPAPSGTHATVAH